MSQRFCKPLSPDRMDIEIIQPWIIFCRCSWLWAPGVKKAKGVRLHKSSTYGVLAMDAYAFSEK